MASHQKELIWIWEEVKEEANLLHSWRDPRPPFLIFWGILIGMPQNTKHDVHFDYKSQAFTKRLRRGYTLALLCCMQKKRDKNKATHCRICVSVWEQTPIPAPSPNPLFYASSRPLKGLDVCLKYPSIRKSAWNLLENHGPRYVWRQGIREVFTYLSLAAQGRKTVFFPYKTMILT